MAIKFKWANEHKNNSKNEKKLNLTWNEMLSMEEPKFYRQNGSVFWHFRNNFYQAVEFFSSGSNI